MAYKSTLRRLKQILIILLICLSAYRDGFSQNSGAGKSVTLSAKRITYGEVFDQVLKQTGTTVWFTEDIGKRVAKDVSFKNTPVQEAMNKILPKDLEWVFRGKDVVVKKKGGSESGVVGASNNFPGNAGVSGSGSEELVDVTGKVIDEEGNPIPGATVLVKNSQTGTATTISGDFLIKEVSVDGTLLISNLSFISREVPVRKRHSIGIIQLTKDVRQLDETVVLAYTKTTGRFLTGNVSKLRSKDIVNSPVNNPILAAAGRLPGITINQSSGFAGSGVEINIQGINSMQRGIAPFIVVDGVPYAQTLLPNFSNVAGTSGRGSEGPVTGNPLSFINPQDIESIEILKDADATAIYGSRAANGAILITTKRGNIGKMKASVNFQTGFGQVARRLSLLNTEEYLSVRHEAKNNDGTPLYPTDYDLNGTWDTTRSIDWQRQLIGNKAKYTDVQMNLSGGNPNVQYLVGGNFHKETTVFPTDLADIKSSVRFNLDAKSNDKRFWLSLSSSYLNDRNKLPRTDLTFSAMTLAPVYPDLLTKDGDLNWELDDAGAATISNPLALLFRYNLSRTDNLIGNLNLGYDLTHGFALKANVGYNRLRTDEVSTEPGKIWPPQTNATAPRSSQFGFNDIQSWIIEPQLTYIKSTAVGTVNVLAGGSFQQSKTGRKEIQASGFSNDEVLENISAATALKSGLSIITQYRYAAAFFSVNVNKDNKYIANITARRDGSSRFGSANRYHTFGAAALAWIFSSENFIEERLPILSFGKVKLSYGTTGNDQIGDYNYLSVYEYNNSDIPYRGGTSLTINRLNNPALQWEETKKLSLGMDLGFFSDRIMINGNYYRNRSSNMLMPGSIPATAGPMNSLTENVPAVIENNGIELLITSTNYKDRDFIWTSSLNFTRNQNQVKSYGDDANSTYSYRLEINQPVDFIRTYKAKGVNPETGKYEFYDKEGKATSDPESDPDNYNVFINPSPKFYGGLTNTLSFHGFHLEFLFSFVKRMGKNVPTTVPPGFERYNQSKSVLDRWQRPGDVKSNQRYFSSDFSYYGPYFYQIQSDAYWQDASYVRLKNASLSYDLPKSWLNKAGFQSCRLYVLAQNLITITGFDGLDPESFSNFSLPPLRVITFGIQASL